MDLDKRIHYIFLYVTYIYPYILLATDSMAPLLDNLLEGLKQEITYRKIQLTTITDSMEAEKVRIRTLER